MQGVAVQIDDVRGPEAGESLFPVRAVRDADCLEELDGAHGEAAEGNCLGVLRSFPKRECLPTRVGPAASADPKPQERAKQDKEKAIDKQFLSTKIAAKTIEENKSLKKVIEQGKGHLCTVQNELINSQREVQRLKDLLIQRAAENTKLTEELDSRFCRFVNTLTGGDSKKRKLGSSSSALTLRDSGGD